MLPGTVGQSDRFCTIEQRDRAIAAGPYDRVHSYSEGKNGEPLSFFGALLFETAMQDTHRGFWR